MPIEFGLEWFMLIRDINQNIIFYPLKSWYYHLYLLLLSYHCNVLQILIFKIAQLVEHLTKDLKFLSSIPVWYTAKF